MKKLFLIICLLFSPLLIRSSEAEILKIRNDLEQNSYKTSEEFIDGIILPLKNQGIEIAAAYTMSLKAQEGQTNFLKSKNLDDIDLAWLMLFSSVCRAARTRQDVVSLLNQIRSEFNQQQLKSNKFDDVIPEDINGMSTYIDNKNHDQNRFQLISNIFFKFSFYTVIPNTNISFNDYKNVFNKYLTIYGMGPISGQEIASEHFGQNAQQIEELQPKNKYLWLKIIAVLGFGGLLSYWFYNKNSKNK